jgi:hypothetical protein
VVEARASYLLTRGRRSGAVTARASHLLVQGRTSGAARVRNKPPIAVLGLPFCELRMLANHNWSNIEKTTTCIRSNSNMFSNTLK